MNTLTARDVAAQRAALDTAAVKCAEVVSGAADLLSRCPGELHDLCTDTMQSACDALDAVVKAGGTHPVAQAAPMLSLASLGALTGPDAEQLLSLLDQAQEIAERIDAAQGRTLAADFPLQPGESRGTDLAEAVSLIAARLRGDMIAPKGRD